MLDAIVGSVIVVMASAALVLAVEMVESSIGAAGRQPLNKYERELLQQARRNAPADIQGLESDLTAKMRQRTW